MKTSLAKISTTAKIYLFSSCNDDSKKGGDINLLIIANDMSNGDLRSIGLDFLSTLVSRK
ncbi:hypothetical protein IB655_04995 [Francisella noatunensis]|uniref:Uncharacterized protein n=1 Tax=Francisella noatunensis TaxID=657445 RepID=A0A9Q2KRN7_9GAMM|nr:hypothetical protein [Francisella noatunensis]MBK2028507.1 hypothetical protein [Francisella noatunensis]MBK2034130.1 hypothetical protein [Francisella noatunensis]MBK2048859.1 hypothetical protein [Francisella noatunensis]MBK2050379.1 hypothetical protein [Francisella noatunensis]MBK2051683.1 hypothetical protein [Francisella noatunensis]